MGWRAISINRVRLHAQGALGHTTAAGAGRRAAGERRLDLLRLGAGTSLGEGSEERWVRRAPLPTDSPLWLFDDCDLNEMR
jgi:hypothetical protein